MPRGALPRHIAEIVPRVSFEGVPCPLPRYDHVGSRRAPPQNDLPLRPADPARAAGRAASARAPLPYGRLELFDRGPTHRAFRELASGSVRELSPSARLS